MYYYFFLINNNVIRRVYDRKLCGTFQKWTIHRGIRRGKNQTVTGSQGADGKASSDSENIPQVQVLHLPKPYPNYIYI